MCWACRLAYRIVLAVALQDCNKRSASSRSSVMVERIDVSVRCNLEKTRSDSHVITGSVPRMVRTVGKRLNLTLLQLQCCRITLPGRSSAAVAVHCWRRILNNRILLWSKNFSAIEGGPHAPKIRLFWLCKKFCCVYCYVPHTKLIVARIWSQL